ncbi:MAG: hypothetical protein IJD92_03350 [Bacilli bacterium]|nr:hypothetical protein [Bacilli bacterium]
MNTLLLKDKLFKMKYLDEIEHHEIENLYISKQNFYKNYVHIIDKFIKLLKALNINNPIEVKIIYEYLLFNGYLSQNKNFELTSNNKYYTSMPGIKIMQGNGVCLNVSDLLNSIYKALGYNSYMLTCNIKNNSKIFYKPNIKRVITEINIPKVSRNLINEIGTHAINLVNNNNNTYLVDATNLDVINLNKKLKGNYVNRDIEIKVLPTFSAALENKIEEIINLLNKCNKVSLEELKSLYEKIIKLCENYKYELNLFHQCIENDIETVCKSLKK